MPEKDGAAAPQALGCVDAAVVLFDEGIPEVILDLLLRPDVFAGVGDHHAAPELPEARLLERWGGRPSSSRIRRAGAWAGPRPGSQRRPQAVVPAEGSLAGLAGGQPTLVVLRALGLGDFLTAVPALRALADAFPHHRRVLAAPAVLSPLAALAGAVDEVVDAHPLAPLDASLGGADVAVNLHGRGPQSHRVLLEARPRCLLSFAHPEVPESAGGPPWRPGEHEVTRWCRLLRAYAIPADPGRLDLELPPEVLAAAPAAARGATLIHPGAASPARRWPPDRWAAVARAEAQAGRRVVVTGGAGEVSLAREVARGAGLGESDVYAGRTDLTGLAALVETAGRVVCGDTGVAHLASALRTPSVVLFGPVPPSEWGPPPDRPWHRALWAGRRGDPHADSPGPGLLEIRVRDVLRELSELPQHAPGAGRP